MRCAALVHQGPDYRLPIRTTVYVTAGEDHFTLAGDLNVGNCDVAGAPPVRDAWLEDSPAPQFVGDWTGARFGAAAVAAVTGHAAQYGASAPLFLYYALHDTHGPIEVPQRYQDMYPNVSLARQRTFYGMASAVDEAVANLTAALHSTGMWNNSLVVVMTDNGSPVTVGGSNAPLRGNKGSNWEGGVRVPAFVTGGALPQSRRGVTSPGLIHVVDFYSTFLSLAGIPDASDGAGPAPVASLNMGPWISGAAPSSPRTELVLDHNLYDPCVACVDHEVTAPGANGALIRGNYKLIVGPRGGATSASWYGDFSPNASGVPDVDAHRACGNDSPPGGCLFDISVDAGEHVDLASSLPSTFEAMLQDFHALNVTAYHPPNDNPADDKAGLCAAAFASNYTARPWRANPLPGAL